MMGCVEECGNDVTVPATCSNGAWTCGGGVDESTCTCTGYAGRACLDCNGDFVRAASCNPATSTYGCPVLTCTDSGADSGADSGPDSGSNSAADSGADAAAD